MLAFRRLLSVVLGEYIYNLRAALDYCVYAVAIYDSKRDPPPGKGQLQFPIYSTEKEFLAHAYPIASAGHKM